MKIDKKVTTKITLTKKEVDAVIKAHIKQSLGVDAIDINYCFDVQETLDLTECVITTTEKVKEEVEYKLSHG